MTTTTTAANEERIKVFIPLICYNHTCHAEYMMSMLTLLHVIQKQDVNCIFSPIFFESLISRARNGAAKEFLDTDCTHLLFIDSDISFTPEDVAKLFQTNQSVVCALYPKKYLKKENFGTKNEIIDFAVSGEIRKINDNLSEIDSVATGFLLIKREVFEKMIEYYPNLKYKNDIDAYGAKDTIMYDFFKVGINPSTLVYDSEDWGFCHLWKKMGGKIYARTDISLGHFGWHQYKGNFNNWIKGIAENFKNEKA